MAADDDTVAEDAGDYTPPPIQHPLDTLLAHHENSFGSVNHSEMSSLIRAIKGLLQARSEDDG
jgi:hypothetical protein